MRKRGNKKDRKRVYLVKKGICYFIKFGIIVRVFSGYYLCYWS